MRITIIIVSYNEAEYLPHAIESCLGQDYAGEIEIIIGDDGSNDGSIEIIESYYKKYPTIIKYFVMERDNLSDIIPSIRVSNIIKRSLSMATGDYVLCLSGDDYYCDNTMFSIQSQILEQDSQCVACVSSFKKVWDDGEEKNIKIKPMIPTLFWSGEYIHLSCFMFKYEVFEDGFLLERFCDDTGLIYSLACKGRWYFEPKVKFAYRQRDKSIMHEADLLELNILEMMLFQDVLNKEKMLFSSFARFAKPFLYVFKHRHELGADKYNKYLKNSNNYPNNYLENILNFDSDSMGQKVKVCSRLICSEVCYYVFKGARIFQKIFNVKF